MVLLAALLAGALLAPYGGPEELLRLPAPIEESSGLASSSQSDAWLFTHQDSGDEARFYAVSTSGALLATYVLPGVQTRDWEDMARGPDEQGRSSLWLADIGDNSGTRDLGLLVHRVPEPQVDPAAAGQTIQLAAPTSFRLRYDDGPRDAEALLVHPRTGRLYVVTKEVFRRPGLYVAPERLDPDGPNPLTRVAELDLPRTTTPGGPEQGGAVRVLVTAGDVAPDGARLAVRTYTDLFEWRLDGDDVAAAVEETPTVTPLPPTEQGEGLAYSRDGSAVLLSSEGAQAPVHRLPRTESPPPSVGSPVTGPPLPAEGRGLLWPGVLVAGGLAAGLLAARALTRRRSSSFPGR